MEMALDILLDAVIDTAKLIPFLFVTYLAMEYLERHVGERSEETIRRAGPLGPIVGAIIGVVPQCGFASAAATLYAGRVVTLGTLFAVFLSTSDEMIPIMIAEQVPVSFMVKVLLIKMGVGFSMGLAVDAVMRVARREGDGRMHIDELCEAEHCHCDDDHEHGHSILRSATWHTLQVTLFIFLVSLALGAVIELVGEATLAQFMSGNPALSVVTASVVGLIPNCAASVAITELYLQGALGAGAMIGGLLTSAGVGLLVLFRTNRPLWQNLCIALALLGMGIVFGAMFTVAGLVL